jgi:hypothetical protein
MRLRESSVLGSQGSLKIQDLSLSFLGVLLMPQKEFFINAIELIECSREHQGCRGPFSIDPGSAPAIGSGGAVLGKDATAGG